MRLRLTTATLARFLTLLFVLLPLGLLRHDTQEVRAEPEQVIKLYLPTMRQNHPLQPSIFGAEINISHAEVAQKGRAANLYWTRYNGIRWSEVEAVQGVRDWTQVNAESIELRYIVSKGLTPIVVVRGTPNWAQLIPGAACGPIRAEHLDAYADFVGEVVTRYSQHPYNIHHWELGNEPDISIQQLAGNGNSMFGCWGVEGDPYFGGEYYAEMLKRVYPAIKRADPTAQVLIGGLLLDCDPTNPPANKSCESARFLEGILRNGGGNFFDMVAYHGYVFWANNRVDWSQHDSNWQTRGGAVLGKLNFIRQMLAAHNISKPVILTEAGLLCHESTTCPVAEFEADKANYAVRLYSRAWANGLQGAIWFTLDGPGWREGGMLDAAQNPRPVFTTVHFLATRLSGGTYVGQDSVGSREGYIFRNAGRTYRIYWTNDTSSTTVSLPTGALVYDKYGRQMFPVGGTMPVGFDPVIIESAN
ncbi:MAG: hypothetical protein H0T73_01195 [Ardenticatenales bacterium]|nr:hypothetical protein [Ardenticatenales bacterium]